MTLNVGRLRVDDTTLGNPLKGIHPFDGYAESMNQHFPISLAKMYFPVSAAYEDDGRGPGYDWSKLEERLDALKEKKAQAIFRFYIDYPQSYDLTTGQPRGVLRPYAFPEYYRHLVSTTSYNVTDAGSFPASGLIPDHTNQNFVNLMEDLVINFCQRYDGDPRIGFIQVGIFGHWGEWNNGLATRDLGYDPFPGRIDTRDLSALNVITKAYSDNLIKSKFECRYPGIIHINSDRVNPVSSYPNMGYHDDSAFWYTRGAATQNSSGNFFFENLLLATNNQNNWITNVIGGEIRPEIQPGLRVFQDATVRVINNNFGVVQDPIFTTDALHFTHLAAFTSLLDLTRGLVTSQNYLNLKRLQHVIGYSFFLQVWYHDDQIISKFDFNIAVGFVNNGSAPFYYKWPVEILLTDGVKKVIHETTWDIRTIYPTGGGQRNIFPFATTIPSAAIFSANFDDQSDIHIELKIKTPATFIPDIKFYNYEQDQNLDGWLHLGTVKYNKINNG